MTGWKQHIAIGSVLTVVLAVLNHRFGWVDVSYKSLVIWFPLVIFYFTLPDIDTRASKARQVATIGLIAMSIYSVFLLGKPQTVTLLIITLILWLVPFTHRGFTHSLAFIVLTSLPLYFIGGPPLAILAGTAQLTHLLLDWKASLY